MHWERLINKLTRIQIRKAQSRGCHGNLQQAPSQLLWGGCRDLSDLATSASKASSLGSAELSMDTGEGQGHRELSLGSHYQL